MYIYICLCIYTHAQKECMCCVEEINIMLPYETTWISVYYISTFSAQRFLLKKFVISPLRTKSF